ncbi:MAG: hypothetical protein ACE5DY_00120 [Mariprofundaceae bacterium]
MHLRSPLPVFLVVLLGLLPSAAQGNADSRLQVSLTQEGQVLRRPPIEDMVRSSLPTLWDRLIPRNHRAQADRLAASSKLVSRIVPGRELSLVVFNASAVFYLLKQSRLPYIPSSPYFNLKIVVENSFGSPMKQSQQLLHQRALEIAEQWGIGLAETAPALVITWRWLNQSNQVEMSVRGNTRLQEYTEVQLLPPGDPANALSQLLEEVMLKARDAYAVNTRIRQTETQQKNISNIEGTLIINRPMSLSEQVVIESGLESERRVKVLIPESYTPQRQSYRLILRSQDDTWLAPWFRRRGMALSLTPEGWLVR